MWLRGKGLWFGLLLVAGFTIVSLLAPILAPYGPTDQTLAARMQPPAWMAGGSVEHLLGTDHLGKKEKFNEIIEDWSQEPSKECAWIIKHGSRTKRKEENRKD